MQWFPTTSDSFILEFTRADYHPLTRSNSHAFYAELDAQVESKYLLYGILGGFE